MATTADTSKIVSYAVLDANGPSASKIVSYAVLEGRAEATKIVSYAVLDAPGGTWGFEQTYGNALTRPPSVNTQTLGAALAGATDIFAPLSEYPAGWEAQSPQPPQAPSSKLAAAALPAAINVDTPFLQWNNFGWENQPPQPPRRPWERVASSLPAQFNRDDVYIFIPIPHEWGFQPVLPEGLPPHRPWERAAAMLPAATNIAAVYVYNFVIIAHEWGFQPVLPEGLRDWFNRSEAFAGPTDIAAPLFEFLPAGWGIQSLQPPRRRWENPAASLPAQINIDARFERFIRYGWQIPPSPLTRLFVKRSAALMAEPFVATLQFTTSQRPQILVICG